MTSSLAHWAQTTPDAVLVARRGPDGEWIRCTYRQAYDRVQSIGAALLARGLSAERPAAISSGNSIEHLLLALAAMHVGIPFAPISTAYSLVSSDYGKLRYILDLLTPGLIFADDARAYGKAMAATHRADAEYVTLAGGGDLVATAFADPDRDDPAAVEAALHARVDHDTIAKFLHLRFNRNAQGCHHDATHAVHEHRAGRVCDGRNITRPAGSRRLAAVESRLGGNQNISLAVFTGGSLYIDDGKPTPAFDQTRSAISRRSRRPAISTCRKASNCSRIAWEKTGNCAKNSSAASKFLMYAGASLPQHVWDALERLAVETIGERIRIVTGPAQRKPRPASCS